MYQCNWKKLGAITVTYFQISVFCATFYSAPQHLSCYASGTLQIWTALIKPYLSVTKTISLINFWLWECHFWSAHRQRHTQNLPKSLGWRCFQQTLAKLVSEYFCGHQFLLQKWTYLIVQISGDYLVWTKTFWNTKKIQWKFSRHHGVNAPDPTTWLMW